MTRLSAILLLLTACGVDPAATLPDAGTGDAGEDLVCTPRVKLPADCKTEDCPAGYVCPVGSPSEAWKCRPRCTTSWTSACEIGGGWGHTDEIPKQSWNCSTTEGAPPRLVTELCRGGVCVHLPGAAEGDDWRPWFSSVSPCSMWNWGPEHWPFRFP